MEKDALNEAYHKMKTQIMVIKEGLSVVLDGTAGPINEKQKNFLNIAQQAAEKLIHLIKDVSAKDK